MMEKFRKEQKIKKITNILIFLLPFTVYFLPLTLCADDYDFDFEAIEVKPYEYSGYIKGEYKHQNFNKNSPLYISSGENSDTRGLSRNELSFDFSYFKDVYKLKSSFLGFLDNLDGDEESDIVINELYINIKPTTNHSLDVGKKSLKWGKGYFLNPIAFFDRPKDPTQPENAKEGYMFADYSYNKTFKGNLKNLTLNLVYMPTSSSLNDDYNNFNSNNLGLKLYTLLYDTDLEFLCLYSDKDREKLGFDFSKNLQTNFEIHGEFLKEISGYSSYLLGLKYLTENELTITSEYFYKSDGLEKKQIESMKKIDPFSAKSYFLTKFSQKEPFDILYFSIYLKNMLNLEDKSHLDTLGFTYDYSNNIEIDLSYNANIGANNSEFGKKIVEDFFWLKLFLYF